MRRHSIREQETRTVERLRKPVFGLFSRAGEAATRKAWVPDGSRVYAVGDIHGSLDRLMRLHDAIVSDAEASGAERKVVVYVGDYVDRGPDSRGVVNLLIEAPLPGFECYHLIGNHEYYMRQFLEDGSTLQGWLMNGGDATLRSFGVDPFVGMVGSGGLCEALRDSVTPAERAFLDGLLWSHVEGDYLFVHAGIRPGVALDEQEQQDLIWIRDPFLSSDQEFGKVVVHGHTPVREPERRVNRIGIDTGAVYGGDLTALVLEADGQSFLKA